MKLSEFLAALPAPDIDVGLLVVNPDRHGKDYESWPVKQATFLVNSSPEDTIIEAGSPAMNYADFYTTLLQQDKEGDVQVYVEGWEGQRFAYFDVNDVQFQKSTLIVKITLGAWRCGG